MKKLYVLLCTNQGLPVTVLSKEWWEVCVVFCDARSQFMSHFLILVACTSKDNRRRDDDDDDDNDDTLKSLLLCDKPIGASPGRDYVLTRMVLQII